MFAVARLLLSCLLCYSFDLLCRSWSEPTIVGLLGIVVIADPSVGLHRKLAFGTEGASDGRAPSWSGWDCVRGYSLLEVQFFQQYDPPREERNVSVEFQSSDTAKDFFIFHNQSLARLFPCLWFRKQWNAK